MSPRRSPIRVAVVGGGLSGIATAVRLKEQLGKNVVLTVIEKADSAGGVWRDSKWPGAEVDVPAHLYGLYSDLNPDWTRHYASQPEVLAFWDGLIDKHNLRESFLFSTEYVGSEWNEPTASHTIHLRLKDGSLSTLTAEVLVGANGPLARPVIPKLPGLDTFKGRYFHNLRWDAKYDFRNKNVAVVGNGSSGIQLVPGVAAIPGVKLNHFIRSGGYFYPKINYEYSAAAKFAFRWIPGLQRAYRTVLFYESDATWRTRNEARVHPTPNEIKLLDYLVREAPAKYLEALKPDYPLGCKRVGFDAGWLKSLHRDNVTLTSSHIVAVDETGLITEDGKHHKTDVIIFATGSDVPNHGVGINVNLKGESGVTLEKYWASIGGPQAYYGVSTPGYPNVFQVIGPNSISGSWGYSAGIASGFIAKLVKAIYDHDLASIQPTQEAFNAHNANVRAGLKLSPMNSQQCQNWWRIGGKGLVTVPGFWNGWKLAIMLSSIEWNDWKAKGREVDSTGKREVVDVGKKVRARKARRNAIWSVPLILAAILRYTQFGETFSSRVLSYARHALDKTRVLSA